MTDPTGQALTASVPPKPIDRVQIIVGNGQPIPVNVNALSTTCPTCSRHFSIDVLEENSARDDVADFERHSGQCLKEKSVPVE